MRRGECASSLGCRDVGERALGVPKSLVGVWILLSSVARAEGRLAGHRIRWMRSRLVDDVGGEDVGL